MAAYSATKSAQMRLTESLADEMRDDGIRVNAVLPTTIDTMQNRDATPEADMSRWIKPSEVAEAMAFLLSDAAIHAALASPQKRIAVQRRLRARTASDGAPYFA